jgi:hypothetical protein
MKEADNGELKIRLQFGNIFTPAGKPQQQTGKSF